MAMRILWSILHVGIKSLDEFEKYSREMLEEFDLIDNKWLLVSVTKISIS